MDPSDLDDEMFEAKGGKSSSVKKRTMQISLDRVLGGVSLAE